LLQGIIVDGSIRDSQAMSSMPLGVKALGTCPLKSDKAAADQGAAQVL
jgi:regulator of ribonuclease activity A